MRTGQHILLHYEHSKQRTDLCVCIASSTKCIHVFSPTVFCSAVKCVTLSITALADRSLVTD
jgi:predicted dinucleotide-utilizing enzyme